MAKIDLPPLPLSGGCNCGAVRYEITGAPLTLYTCHCTTCQTQTGSAFAMSLRVRPGDLRIIKGEPRSYSLVADSGRAKALVFCPDCGTRLWHEPRDGADISIKPGTLDDTSWLRPVGHLWTRSKQPWVQIEPGLLEYEGQPESFDALIAAFQES